MDGAGATRGIEMTMILCCTGSIDAECAKRLLLERFPGAEVIADLRSAIAMIYDMMDGTQIDHARLDALERAAEIEL